MLNSEKAKSETNYAFTRLATGAILGFMITFLVVYFWICYSENIDIWIGLGILRNPYYGMSLVGMSFFGTILGAILSLFSRKWRHLGANQ